jgi:hypothetical protein
MASRMSDALQLPRISIEKRFDYDKEEIIKEMMASPLLITSYRTKEGESRFLFTGLGEDEFNLVLPQVNRLIPVYDFFKTIIQQIDCARLGTMEQQMHMIEAIKYLNLKNPIL